MPTIDENLAEALNMLLEDERASVEMEIAFAMGATEYRERETLRVMAHDDITTCTRLHEWLERAEVPVSWQVNGIVLHILNMEHYDERLLAFAQHQRATAEQAATLQGAGDDDLSDILLTLQALHTRHAGWAERWAADFAASRTMELSPAGRPLPQAQDADADLAEMPGAEASASAESGENGAHGAHGAHGENGAHPPDPVADEARALLREEEATGAEEVDQEPPPTDQP